MRVLWCPYCICFLTTNCLKKVHMPAGYSFCPSQLTSLIITRMLMGFCVLVTSRHLLIQYIRAFAAGAGQGAGRLGNCSCRETCLSLLDDNAFTIKCLVTAGPRPDSTVAGAARAFVRNFRTTTLSQDELPSRLQGFPMMIRYSRDEAWCQSVISTHRLTLNRSSSAWWLSLT